MLNLVSCQLESPRKQTWHWKNKSMYLLLKMVIFQPVMLVKAGCVAVFLRPVHNHPTHPPAPANSPQPFTVNPSFQSEKWHVFKTTQWKIFRSELPRFILFTHLPGASSAMWLPLQLEIRSLMTSHGVHGLVQNLPAAFSLEVVSLCTNFKKMSGYPPGN